MGYRHKSKERYYGSASPSRNEGNYIRKSRSPSTGRDNKRSGDKRPMNIIGTRILYFDTKKFYVDIVKESSEKMLKITEVLPLGQKSSIFMDMETAEDFKNRVTDFCDFISSNVVEENDHREGQLRTDTIRTRDSKIYYLDLRVNHRGMFLRVKLRCSMVFVQVVIPANGLRRFRNAVRDLLSEHGSDKRRKVSIIPIDQPIVINHEFNRMDEVTTSEDVKVKKKRQNSEERVKDEKKPDCTDRMFQFEVKITNEDSFLSINSKFKSVAKVPKRCWEDFLCNIGEKLNELVAAHGENESTD